MVNIFFNLVGLICFMTAFCVLHPHDNLKWTFQAIVKKWLFTMQIAIYEHENLINIHEDVVW